MGSKLDTKQMEVLSLLTSGQAGPERNGGDGESSDQQRPVGTHPKQQLGGVVIISIFLITSKEVPLPCGHQAPRGQKSQQEELRGDGGEKGQSRRFFTFTGK